MTHDQHIDDVAGYALGALNELEKAAFERHLMRCDTCARELENLRVAVEALPAAVPYHPAPPELKTSLMATVRKEAEERTAATAPARRRPSFRLPQLLRARPAMALAGGLACAALALGAYGVGTTRSGDEREVVVAAVDRKQVPGARAELVSRGDIGVLTASRLPRLSSGEVYVVWIDRGDGPEYASAFDVEPDGSGEAAVPDLDGVERVMVTREASTAVAHPTSSPLITAQRS